MFISLLVIVVQVRDSAFSNSDEFSDFIDAHQNPELTLAHLYMRLKINELLLAHFKDNYLGDPFCQNNF